MDGDPSIHLEIGIIILLIIANGLFAMTEIAIVSSRKPRLQKFAEAGHAGAKTALRLTQDPTSMLSMIQIGISIIGVATGAYGGTTIAQSMTSHLVPYFGPYAHSAAMGLVIAAITYFTLIIGELVPKRLALNAPESIAMTLALPMSFLAKLFLPLVKFLSFSTHCVLRFLRMNQPVDQTVTEDEIKIMIAEGTVSGTFEEREKELVDRVFRLGDMKVSALMTPRAQIDWLDLDETDEENWQVISASPHSAFPVAHGSLDAPVGVVYARDILAVQRDGTLSLQNHIQQPLIVPRSMMAFRLLEQFQQTGTHIAFVLDEFGGISGLVTIYDILEQLVGELPLDDSDMPSIIRRNETSWFVDGLLPIEELKDLLRLEELPLEDKNHYQTVGGFITSYLGNVPQVGASFQWESYQFEVVDMDRMRIDKVIVTQVAPLPQDEPDDERRFQ